MLKKLGSHWLLRLVFQNVVIFFPLLACATPRTSVAVVDFDYLDTSGESRNQVDTHAARLAEFTQSLRQEYAADGRFKLVSLACATPPCSAGNLPAGVLEKAAASAHVRLIVYGGLHKMSTLVQWIKVEVLDVETGHIRLSRTLSFRGDTENAWRHAASYVSAIVLPVRPE